MDNASISFSLGEYRNAIISALDTMRRENIIARIWAKDYTGGEELNRYRLVVSKKNWFPTRIERFNREEVPIEVITFKDYEIQFTEERD